MQRLACLMMIAILGSVQFGCSTITKTSKIEKSGFLRNYHQLKKPEKSDEAQLLYINDDVQLSKYDKIMIDPIQIWGTVDAKLPYKDRQMLMNYLDKALRDTLKKDYKIVSQAGPRTMRLRVAITDAKGAQVLMDIASHFVPGSFYISLVPGTNIFAGEGGIEAEVIDSMTGERFMACVDRRVGGRSFFVNKSKWKAVKATYNEWSKQLKLRFTKIGTSP